MIRLSFALTVLCPTVAMAGMITFDEPAFDIPYSGVPNVTQNGVTFSALEDGLLNTQMSMYDTRALRSAEINPPSRMPFLRADFATPVNDVSVWMGDWGGSDADLLFLDAYDLSGALLGHDEFQVAAEQGGLFMTLVDADNISFVIFGAETAPTTLRPNGTSSVIADDFGWGPDAGSAVSAPEPSPIVLGLVALGVMALVRRRRRNTGRLWQPLRVAQQGVSP